MRKLIPILLGLVGLAAGGGAGFALRPDEHEAAVINSCGPEDIALGAVSDIAAHGSEQLSPTAYEYVKLNNQFVVPVVERGVVAALVVLSMSLEVATGHSEEVYAVEPKLRDAFLQVLFDHANAGGFEGAFTQSNKMDVLRSSLLEIARKTLGATVSRVLIENIVRQDS